MRFEWSTRKNELLKSLGFEECADAIQHHFVVKLDHKTNCNRIIFIVRVRGVLWVIIVEKNESILILITNYRDRRLDLIYGQKNES